MASSSKRERSPEEVAANVRRKPQLAAQCSGSRKQHLLCSLQSSLCSARSTNLYQAFIGWSSGGQHSAIIKHNRHGVRHTSHVTRRTSHFTRHTSHGTRHTVDSTRFTPHVKSYTSHATCHTSHATCHTINSATINDTN